VPIRAEPVLAPAAPAHEGAGPLAARPGPVGAVAPDTWLGLLAASPPETRASQVESLQQTAGNRAVVKLVEG